MGSFSKAILTGLLLVTSGPALAQQRCPDRITVSRGDTLSAIANACGTSVERLRDANPGVQARSLQAGTFLNIPRGAITTPPQRFGRPSIELAPRLQIAPGTTSPTVILSPQPIPVPQQHILPGFGNRPGQLPLPPGHAPDFP